MKDYNEAWQVLHQTVAGMEEQLDLTPQDVLERLDTIVAAACMMSREVETAAPVEVAVFRHEQMKRIAATDGPGAA